MTSDTFPVGYRPNPFTTRQTRPGRLPPLDEAGRARDLEPLVAEARRSGGAAIVGPHGTGKSTLLLAVEARLAAVGESAGVLPLREPGDALRAVPAVLRSRPGRWLCIDGWERLGRSGALLVRLLAWLRGCRLLVTSHRPAGLPTIVRTTGSLSLLTAIVGRLPDHGGLITPVDLAEAYGRHGGNLRDSLDELYDRFECRVRRS